MTYDPLKHHRRSIRLKGYDYTSAGAYFITVVAQDRACIFGEVVEGAVRLNEAGSMVQTAWDELPAHYPGIAVDTLVVMPNHIHGIVVLNGHDTDANQKVDANGRPLATGQARGPAPTVTRTGPWSLPEVVHRFKTLTTTRYIIGVKQSRWPGFRKRVWQRNYYEEIIRNEAALDRLRRYIVENPLRWEHDEDNPRRAGG